MARLALTGRFLCLCADLNHIDRQSAGGDLTLAEVGPWLKASGASTAKK
jgi:hypothetical protein